MRLAILLSVLALDATIILTKCRDAFLFHVACSSLKLAGSALSDCAKAKLQLHYSLFNEMPLNRFMYFRFYPLVSNLSSAHYIFCGYLLELSKIAQITVIQKLKL